MWIKNECPIEDIAKLERLNSIDIKVIITAIYIIRGIMRPGVSEMGFEDNTGVIVMYASFANVYSYMLLVVGD